ncbi:hypothetical protein ACCC96_01890 [Pseudomonas sp. Pseusp11]|uniref:hypothetical protein n=1 Tax=Pseudomonas sp. Pseusp11 TaxID=3243003 RepID=UPI0039B67EA8
MSMLAYLDPTKLSCAFAFFSAIAWTRSATVRVPYSLRDSNGKLMQAPSTGIDKKGRFNLQDTTYKQAYWNRLAAGFGAVAAMCQAIKEFPL